MKPVKCLIWDLDDVVWAGSLLEGDRGELRAGVREAIEALDARGVLQSIASASDPDGARAQLEELGLAKYFLHPQIDVLGDKTRQIAAIADRLGFGLDQLAFIDDSPHQRGYVEAALPEIEVLGADEVRGLLERPRFAAEFRTAEAASRRELYATDEERRAAEAGWRGRRVEFLESCKLVATVGTAKREDADRVAELVVRTNRFHAASRRYTREEVREAIDHIATRVSVARLSDRFGAHGIVGAAVLDTGSSRWSAGALVVSCRVQGLGVGDALLVHALRQARDEGAESLEVGYRPTARNRAMTLLFARYSFEKTGVRGDLTLLEHGLREIPAPPKWLTVVGT